MTDAVTDAKVEAAGKGMLLSWWAAQQPDAPAIISPHGSRTFAELNGRANQVVRALRARGVHDGASVALMGRNSPQWVEVWVACSRAGYRLTPINWHLTGEEAGYIADDCEAVAFVADAAHAAAAVDAVGRAPGVTVRLAVGGAIDGFDDYEKAIAAEDVSDIDDPVLGSQMLYTSGTTGRPKGVTRSAVSAASSAAAVLFNIFGYEAGDDMHLCTGPLYHAAPLAFSLASPLTHGVGVMVMDQWDAEETLRLIEDHRITHTHMVPTMFVRLLKLDPEARDRYDISTLRHVLHGAAPCPVSVKQALIEWLGPVVFEYYAATEGTATVVDSETWLAHPGTVGKVDPPEQVRIGDEDGNELPRGEVGLVYMRAPDGAHFEYYKDSDKTASAYRGNYFTLGDVGYVDEEGYLFLTDRTANLIISGGVNIYPAEVDAVLLEHPSVLDVATIGIPDPDWGETVLAVVELRPGVDGTPALADELIELARGRLAHYKCPRRVDFVKSLPRQDNGKIYKRLLRDQYRATADQKGS